MNQFIAIAVIAVLILGGMLGMQYMNVSEEVESLNSDSETFVRELIPELVAGGWDQSVVFPVAHRNFTSQVNPADWQKIATIYTNSFGALNELGPCEGDANLHEGPQGRYSTANYSCEAFFEKDGGVIEIGVGQEEGVWKLMSIRINSPALSRYHN